MASYKSFAVVGAGMIGLPIINALAERNASVVLLSRPGSSTKAVPSAVEIVQVDYNDVTAVATVFKQFKVEVVLSTVNFAGIAAQKSLIDAAKIAAVKLFAPSEYGAPTDTQPAGASNPIGGIAPKNQIAKNQIAEYLKSVNLPSMRIFTGLFIEVIPWLVGYSDHGKVRIVGKGEAPASFTSVTDIAGFVAYVLTTLPPTELEDSIFRLEGERSSLNDLGGQFKTLVEHVDRIEGEAGEVKTGLLLLLGSGAGSTGWDEAKKAERSGTEAAGSANALWQGHRWKTIKEVLNL
ncbi:NmrA domain-containing protein [Mycena venus]|uniref:NmrA domain-containing protein n=1 Tax=Mycena venus TaxID=2733690 RepID=A0A8H6X7Q4_9AGAR|nr:NmrA domain-containing protein [Mycena venus]